MVSHYNMVSPQNGDTRGGVPPSPPSDATASDSITLFGLHLYSAGRCYKNPLSARGPAQCKSGLGITCLVNIIIYCTIFQSGFKSTWPVLRHKILLKK